jgi:hypothetical protein
MESRGLIEAAGSLVDVKNPHRHVLEPGGAQALEGVAVGRR